MTSAIDVVAIADAAAAAAAAAGRQIWYDVFDLSFAFFFTVLCAIPNENLRAGFL